MLLPFANGLNSQRFTSMNPIILNDLVDQVEISKRTEHTLNVPHVGLISVVSIFEKQYPKELSLLSNHTFYLFANIPPKGQFAHPQNSKYLYQAVCKWKPLGL